MIEIAVLALLKDSDLHGYEIRRKVREELGGILTASYGSLYPTLKHLSQTGAVEEISPSPKEKLTFSPGSLSGEKAVYKRKDVESQEIKRSRSKKVYRITPFGENLLLQMLNEPINDNHSDSKMFLVKLAFSKFLPSSARLALLNMHRYSLKSKLEQIQSEQNSKESVCKSTLIDRSLAIITAELTWLENLINNEEKNNGEQTNEQIEPLNSAVATD